MEAKNISSEPPPVKKYEYIFVYSLFYILGVVTVVPSNFFITATDYWMYKFRDVGSNASYDSNNKTTLQKQFTSNYSIVGHVSYVTFVIITIRFIRNFLTTVQRTFVVLCGAIAIFALTCILVEVNTDSWQGGFFVVTLVLGFILTGLCGIFMVTLFETAAKFPTGFIPALFSGQAICGIFAAVVQIIVLGVGAGPRNTGLIYFLIATLFIVFSLIAFFAAFTKSDFFKYNFTREPTSKKKLVINKKIITSAFSKIKFRMCSMVLVLGCTIILYPGVTTLVVSTDKGNGNGWNDTFFGPVVNFFLYYLFDYLGREVAIFFQKPTNDIFILILSCCRIPLVPLIVFCNVQPREHSEVAINSDSAYIIFLLILALSNGFLVNLNILRIPQITTEEERPLAMICILLLMIVSMAISSVTSSALVNAV